MGIGALIGGGISAVGSVAGSALQAGAATSAAATEAGAANSAAAMQLQMFQTLQSNLQPYMQAGTQTLPILSTLLGVPNAGVTPGSQQDITNWAQAHGFNVPAAGQSWTPQEISNLEAAGYTPGGGAPQVNLPSGLSAGQLITPFQPTQAQLQATPGYQFTLNQGLQATQNAYAAQGLGTSGAALKGAANYAEGLASTTYQQQFQNYWTQNQNIYSMLTGMTNTGENAAAMTGNLGTSAASSAASALMAGASASAAGTVGSANAIAGGVNSLGSLGLFYGLMSNPGMYSGTGGVQGNQQSATPQN